MPESAEIMRLSSALRGGDWRLSARSPSSSQRMVDMSSPNVAQGKPYPSPMFTSLCDLLAERVERNQPPPKRALRLMRQ